jgi:hypothetical protein
MSSDFITSLPEELLEKILENCHVLHLWLVTRKVSRTWNVSSERVFLKVFPERISQDMSVFSYGRVNYHIASCESDNTELWLKNGVLQCTFSYDGAVWDTYDPCFRILRTLWYPLNEVDLVDWELEPLYDDVQLLPTDKMGEDLIYKSKDKIVVRYDIERVSESFFEIEIKSFTIPFDKYIGWIGCAKVDRKMSEILNFEEV